MNVYVCVGRTFFLAGSLLATFVDLFRRDRREEMKRQQGVRLVRVRRRRRRNVGQVGVETSRVLVQRTLSPASISGSGLLTSVVIVLLFELEANCSIFETIVTASNDLVLLVNFSGLLAGVVRVPEAALTNVFASTRSHILSHALSTVWRVRRSGTKTVKTILPQIPN